MKALLLTLTLMLIVPVSQAETLKFGIVPQQSAKKLARLWTPIMQYLSAKTGHQIIFSTAQDIPAFEQRLLQGEYDIAYMNPYHFTVFQQKPGYHAIAKQKDKVIKGIIVVPKDSPITSLQALAGQTLAFPSPAAFAASVLPRAKMQQDKIAFTPKYVSSHDSVYLTVSRGIFPAGGGVKRTFNNTDPAVREKLKVLWETPGYTSHAIAVHPDMKAEVKAAVQQALVDMTHDPEGMALLKAINFKGIEAADDARWDDVKALDIQLLQHLLQ